MSKIPKSVPTFSYSSCKKAICVVFKKKTMFFKHLMCSSCFFILTLQLCYWTFPFVSDLHRRHKLHGNQNITLLALLSRILYNAPVCLLVNFWRKTKDSDDQIEISSYWRCTIDFYSKFITKNYSAFMILIAGWLAWSKENDC